MRINIIKTTVNGEYLYREASSFENREAMLPYLIMSNATLKSLVGTDPENLVLTNDGSYEYGDYKILINEDLRFGDVDIR